MDRTNSMPPPYVSDPQLPLPHGSVQSPSYASEPTIQDSENSSDSELSTIRPSRSTTPSPRDRPRYLRQGSRSRRFSEPAFGQSSTSKLKKHETSPSSTDRSASGYDLEKVPTLRDNHRRDKDEPDLGLQLSCSIRPETDRRTLEEEHPPDGGFNAWLQVLGMHITVFATWGFINGFGVFQAYYANTLKIAPSTISWIGSIQTFLVFALGTFTGRALDAGHFYLVYRLGSFFIVLGIFLTSLCSTYPFLFLCQGLLCGIGSGLVFCPTVALTSTYFSTRRSLALGIGATGSATGGIVITLIIQQLLPKLGFAWTVRVIGFVVLTLFIISNLILRTRVKPRKLGGIIDWTAWREIPYACFAGGMFLIMFGLFFGFFYVSAYARTRLNVSKSSSDTLILVINAVGIPGRLIPNFIADKSGSLNLLLPFVFISAILVYVWIGVQTHAGLLVWAAFYGFFAAGIQSLFPATLGSLTSDLAKAGTRMGMVFSVMSVACLTGPPVGGAVIGRMGGSYLGAQVLAAGVMMVGGCILVVSRWGKVGWRWKVKA